MQIILQVSNFAKLFRYYSILTLIFFSSHAFCGDTWRIEADDTIGRASIFYIVKKNEGKKIPLKSSKELSSLVFLNNYNVEFIFKNSEIAISKDIYFLVSLSRPIEYLRGASERERGKTYGCAKAQNRNFLMKVRDNKVSIVVHDVFPVPCLLEDSVESLKDEIGYKIFNALSDSSESSNIYLIWDGMRFVKIKAGGINGR